MNMQTTSGLAARDHGRKIVARKIAAAAAGDRGELPEDSCLAPSFGLAGFLGCSVLRSCWFGRHRRTNYDLRGFKGSLFIGIVTTRAYICVQISWVGGNQGRGPT